MEFERRKYHNTVEGNGRRKIDGQKPILTIIDKMINDMGKIIKNNNMI